MLYNILDESNNYITSNSYTGVVKGDYVKFETTEGVLPVTKELMVKKITHINEDTCNIVVGQPSKK